MQPLPVLERMTRAAFRTWAAGLPEGMRFERVGGLPVAMAPERAGHTRVKARIWRAMEAALKQAGSPCEALADGITVEIGDDTDYEPDVVINCGPPIPDEALAAPSPVVIVEVLSPGTSRTDTGAKLEDYFLLPSVRHYLVVRADRQSVVLHSREDEGGPIRTHIQTSGEITLAPPGITLNLTEFFER